ncbi:hypothetical protein ACQ4PT_048930 [Festuca glaucescens]
MLTEDASQEILTGRGNIDEQPRPPEESAPEEPNLVQHPVYFINTVLRDARERYTMQQKLLYMLLIASRKLCHYFQGHPITVVTSYPLEQVLHNQNVTGRMAEWAVELQPFELTFKTTKVIKSKALAEFTAEWTDPFVGEANEDESTLPGEIAPDHWTMHFDGAFNTPGAGAGAVLTSPTTDKLFYAMQLYFQDEYKVSNNIAKYEGLLARLRAANALGIKRIIIKGDSQLIVNFSNKRYTPKDEHMTAYLEEHRKMEKRFLGMELRHIPRGENQEVDDIARRASHRLPQHPGVFEERLLKPSATPLAMSEEPVGEELPPPPATGAPDRGGYRYLYVAIDKFTKWAEVEPVRLIPARSAVKFIKGLVCRFGVPNRIITDNGSQFTSGLFKAYYASIGTKICYPSEAHPRSNVQAERVNAEVLKGLKTKSFDTKLKACGKKWLDSL